MQFIVIHFSKNNVCRTTLTYIIIHFLNVNLLEHVETNAVVISWCKYYTKLCLMTNIICARVIEIPALVPISFTIRASKTMDTNLTSDLCILSNIYSFKMPFRYHLLNDRYSLKWTCYYLSNHRYDNFIRVFFIKDKVLRFGPGQVPSSGSCHKFSFCWVPSFGAYL